MINNFVKEQNWWKNTAQSQDLLQTFSKQDSVVWASRQTSRSKKQNKDSRNRLTYIQTTDILHRSKGSSVEQR